MAEMSYYPPEMDPTQGYITAQEVRNVFVDYLRKLDKEFLATKYANRDIVFKLVETMQYELFRRCQQKIPFKATSSRPTEPPPDSRAEYEALKTRIKNR